MKAWLMVEIDVPTIVAATQAEAQRATNEHLQHLAEVAARRVLLRSAVGAQVLRYGWAEAPGGPSAPSKDADGAWEAGRE